MICKEGYRDIMPSRMDRYYKNEYNTRKRTVRNQDLYKSIYEDVEYSNVEGISIIEKNEKIDIAKIKELIDSSNQEKKSRVIEKKIVPIPEINEGIEENKNYDIRDILNKAKNERPEIERNNTQYDILKSIRLNEELQAPQSLSDNDLKQMIDKITNNSKISQTSDLLDELKTIHEPLKGFSEPKEEKEPEIDQTFFTSSLSFSNEDFEEIKEDIKTNNTLTKVLIFILSVIIVTGLLFLIYHFI